MKRFLYLFLSILSAETIFAQKVEITSEDMSAYNIKKEVHFINNVKIKQLENWIHADKVIVYFNENNETDKYKATGSVKFKFKDNKNNYQGSSDILVYLPIESRYILKGKASIEDINNKRHIKGDKIILDMKSGNANVEGNPKRPVKFIFDMEHGK